ncbi:hypothetical protein GIB67_036216, partial [Kingdonia uniflora]
MSNFTDTYARTRSGNMTSTNDANVELNKKIIDLYSDPSFEDIWGTHMHHGFYDLNSTTKPNVQTAQICMIEEALRFANVPVFCNNGYGLQVTFQVPDVLLLPFSNRQFGTVWSLECGDHLPDKTKFVSELVSVAAPGGPIILTTLCIGDLTPNEESLKPQERELLQSLCESMCLLEWISCVHYADLFKSHTMKVLP